MPEQLIIIQTGRTGGLPTEVVYPPSEEDARRFLEALLERGADPSSIRVYRATEVEMQISHRPVVSLGTPDGTIATASAEADSTPGDEGVPEFLGKYYEPKTA